MPVFKRVAVIGLGPAGAISIDALAQEKAFDVIRVFERREKAGGCWIQDAPDRLPSIRNLKQIANRESDQAVQIPEKLPHRTKRITQNRHAETSVYPLLETNIDTSVMEFSQEKIPKTRSKLSISKHGHDTPFAHHSVVQEYIQNLVNRNGYDKYVEYNTTVEKIEKLDDGKTWRVYLRKEEPTRTDYWWFEDFDAVLVANGHYTVPWIPDIPGLQKFAAKYPGAVEHSKGYRGPEKYRGKKVVVVGASVSGMDIAFDLIPYTQLPVHTVVRGKWHPYFGGSAFDHPRIQKHPEIKRIDTTKDARTVYFDDGRKIEDVDHIILGTGYQWSLPFLRDVEVRNNRLPGLYLHVFKRGDPTLAFIGAVAAGLTFKVYEWQAVLAARYLAGRIELPAMEVQKQWEDDRIAYKGDGVPFTALYPDFEDYFETVRRLAGEPTSDGRGRRLPEFEKKWVQDFQNGHQRRIEWWERQNRIARRQEDEQQRVRARL